MKNKDNISKARIKTVKELESSSSYLSELSPSEASMIWGGLQMDDGTLYFGKSSYLQGKVNPVTGKPSEMRFGKIDDYNSEVIKPPLP